MFYKCKYIYIIHILNIYLNILLKYVYFNIFKCVSMYILIHFKYY